jgi:hypothetical protein
MKATELADKYQYSLPYSRQDVLDIYQEGYRQALADVLKLSSGEVINGTLQGMICEAKVKDLQSS